MAATFYTFGFKRGVGGETISEFLARLRLTNTLASFVQGAVTCAILQPMYFAALRYV